MTTFYIIGELQPREVINRIKGDKENRLETMWVSVQNIRLFFKCLVQTVPVFMGFRI